VPATTAASASKQKQALSKAAPVIGSKTLWIGNIPPQFTEAELAQVAGNACTSVFIKPSVGEHAMRYGFANYSYKADAIAAKALIEAYYPEGSEVPLEVRFKYHNYNQ
jgi:hypothetical protein